MGHNEFGTYRLTDGRTTGRLYNNYVNRMLKMLSNALTNVEKHVTPNNASMHCQQYSNNTVF